MKKYTSMYLIHFKFYFKKRNFILLYLLLLFFYSNTYGLPYLESNKPIELKNYYPPATIPCNTDLPVPITNSTFSNLSVSEDSNGVCLGCDIENKNFLTDTNNDNYANIITAVGIGVTQKLKVTNNTTDEFFPAGSYAGFLIENSAIVKANLLSGIVITTYLDGIEQESNTNTSLATINSTLLGNSNYYVGFDTSKNYDALEISFSSVVNVAATTKVYYAVTNAFCAGPTLECNTPTKLIKPTFPVRVVDEHTGFTGVSLGNISDKNNAIDSNVNNYATIDLTLGVLSTATFSIKDELVDYPAKTFAAYDIETSSILDLSLLGNITISTYLNGNFVESRTGTSELLAVDSGLLLTGSQRLQVGFVSEQPFDEVQITFTEPVNVDLGSTKIYGLALETFCDGTLECSSPTVLNTPSHPVIINSQHTGTEGLVCVACEVDNPNHVISESNSDFATINVTAGVANSASISVQNALNTFSAGTDAGFIIRDSNNLLQADLLNTLTVNTYLNGTPVEEISNTNLLTVEALGLINITPSSSQGFYKIGFTTTSEYDEIRLTVNGLVGVLNQIEVYGSYVDKTIKIEGSVINETSLNAANGSISVSVTGGTPPYSYSWSPGGETGSSINNLSSGVYTVTVTDAAGCQSVAEFIVYTDGVQYEVPCNTEAPVAITNAGFTDLETESQTYGLINVGGITDEANLIDTDVNNYATMSSALGVGTTRRLRITDTTPGEFFQAGNYAGFLIENPGVLQADLINNIVIRTYLDGNELENTNNSASLVALNSTLLSSDKYYVGFYTTQDFDAIQIEISSLASVLSTTRVYHMVTNRFCAGPDLECNTPTLMKKPDQPVRIVDEHTGIDGLLNLGSIDNTDNILDSNDGNFASINLLASVAGDAKIAVKNEITDYPTGTYAGFDIENSTLLSTELFDAITISTFLDGTLVESKTGTSELLPVSSGLLLTGSEKRRVGFITTSAFDEVQIKLSQTLSINLGNTKVYGMVLEKFCEYPINCDEAYVLSNPSNSVIINNDLTGTEGLACVACEVDNASNVLTADTSDFALINVVAGVASNTSISVKDVLTDYPIKTDAGFVIRDTNDLLQVDLLNSLTITTYLDGVEQEQQTGENFLTLEALGLINITPTTTDGAYIVKFESTKVFDEVRLTVGSLVSAITSIEVYGAYIDTRKTDFCDNAEIAIIKESAFNDTNSDGCSNVGEKITYTFTLSNEGNISIKDIELTDPLIDSGNPINLASGDINADGLLNIDETWIYTADYTITQADIDAGKVENQASVTGTSLGGTAVNDLSDDDSVTENDITVTTLCQTQAVAMIKQGTINTSAPSGCSAAGDTIDYVFTVTNEGNTTLTALSVNDPLLGGPVAYSSGDDNSNNILEVDETWTYTGTYTIQPADINAASVTNQATVEASTVTGATINDLSDDDSILEDDETIIALCQDPGIALIKTATFNDLNGDGCSDANETLTYTFSVTNQGNTALSNVTLNDSFLSGTIDLASGDANSDNVLNVGETWIYTKDYALTQSDIDAGMISNQAEVSAESSLNVIVKDVSDDDSVLEDDATETTLCQSAKIAVIKTAMFNDLDGDGCTNVNETISYTFTVTNQGNVSINSVALNDPLLGGNITLASGDTNSNSILEVDETWIYKEDYSINQTDIDNGIISNQATVTATGADGTAIQDVSDDDSVLEDDATETALCQSAKIAVIKTAMFNDLDGDGCTNVNETISYTFTVTNQGNVSINTVALNDPLLGGNITLASGDTNSNSILEVDETWIYKEDYSIKQADIDNGIISNQATVTATGADGTAIQDVSDDDSVLEDDATETTLCQSAKIAVIKTAMFNDLDGDGCTNVNETISYTFTVTNQGNVSINSVALNDPLLGGNVTLASGDTNSNSILEVDETWIYKEDYSIKQADIDNGIISNQATVTATGADGTAIQDVSDDDSVLEDDATETTLCQSAKIAVIKTAMFNDLDGDGCTNVNETISYTFTVTNQGNVSINSVALNDPLLGGNITLASGDTNSNSILEVDETWIYKEDYSIKQADIDNGIISNQATVTATGADGTAIQDVSDDDSVLEDDATETALCQSAKIAVIKTAMFNDLDGDGCTNVNETISYTFTVTNQGNVSINSVALNDPLLGGNITLASGDTNSNSILEVDETWIYKEDYSINQTDIDNGIISNQATVTATGADGTAIQDVSDDDSVLEDDATETALCQSAKIAVIKTAMFNDLDGDGCTNVNETISYTFTVTNQGNVSINSVALNDPLLGGNVTLASGDTNSNSILEVDETWIYKEDYSIKQADIDNGIISNQATVTATGADGTAIQDVSDDDSVLEDDATETTLCQSAKIAVIKTAMFNDLDGDGCTNVNETISYTFTVTNQGNVSINSVALNDPLLGGNVTLASGDTNSNSILEVDETWIYKEDYSINQTDIDNGIISNQATVTATGADGTAIQDVSDDDSVLEDDATETTLCQSAKIAVIKTAMFNDLDGDGCTNVNETISYTFTVTNQGNVSINSVALNDPLLGGNITLASGDTNSNSILEVDETWIYKEDYSINQTDIDNGIISNQATVTATGADGTAIQDVSDDDSVLEDDATETALCQSAKIAVIKTAMFNDLDGDGCTNVNETISYTFTVTNQGNVSINSVALNDPLLGGNITLASGDTNSNSILEVDETWIYKEDYNINQTDIDNGIISNQATVTATGADGTAIQDVSDDDSVLEDDATETTLCQSAKIAVIKTAMFNDLDGDGCTNVNETISYTFTVTNQGNVSINSVALNDPLLGGNVTLASGDTNSNSILEVDETWIYKEDYSIKQADIDNGIISNQATVTATGADGTAIQDVSDDNSVLEDDPTETTLCQSAKIAVIKTAMFNDLDGDGCTNVNETISYTFTVSNQGNSDIKNVILIDPMLGGTISITSGDNDGDNELDADETWIYTSTYILSQSDLDIGIISNQATVTGISSDGTPIRDLSDDNSILEDDPTEITLCLPASISIEKTGVFNDENDSDAAQAGETISYTFTISNTGTVTLYNINIEDELPGITIDGEPILQLLPGETNSIAFTATYPVTTEDIISGSVTNKATVNATDVLGNIISNTDEVITELPDLEDAEFKIYNAVSPNGDGKNDYFFIKGIENYPNNNMKIFNRWGNLLYEIDGYGTNNKVFTGIPNKTRKEEVATGTYFYILTRYLDNGKILTDNGYLYLKGN